MNFHCNICCSCLKSRGAAGKVFFFFFRFGVSLSRKCARFSLNIYSCKVKYQLLISFGLNTVSLKKMLPIVPFAFATHKDIFNQAKLNHQYPQQKPQIDISKYIHCPFTCSIWP